MALIVLAIGKRSIGKGAFYLAGAMHRVHRARPDVTLVWLGPGGDGQVPHEQVAGWMRCAALVVHPSLCEGAPRAVREALAASCIVIATDTPGTVECRPTLLVPPRDPVALAEAILKALP